LDSAGFRLVLVGSGWGLTVLARSDVSDGPGDLLLVLEGSSGFWVLVCSGGFWWMLVGSGGFWLMLVVV
jgi:hypothetical protein